MLVNDVTRRPELGNFYQYKSRKRLVGAGGGTTASFVAAEGMTR
jgi:hypothetical protein